MGCKDVGMCNAYDGCTESVFVGYDLERFAVDALCLATLESKLSEGTSVETAKEAAIAMRKELLVRERVLVEDGQWLDWVHTDPRPIGLTGRFDQRFLIAHLDDCKNTSLVFLPLGWRLVQLPLFRMILDDKGRARGQVRPKEGFEHIGCLELDPYYELSARSSCDDDDLAGEIRVTNYHNECIKSFKVTEDMLRSEDGINAMAEIVRNWIDETYPNWRHPLAYWDD